MRVIQKRDYSELLNLYNNGLPSYKYLQQFDLEVIQSLCICEGWYVVPTQELIQFLRDEIGSSSVIEIGSGNGLVAKRLGIKATDSCFQDKPDVRLYYKTIGNATVKYGSNVEEIEAVDAVKKYKPHTVLGCWVTQKSKYPSEPQSLYCGVDEEEILQHCKKYIVVGNRGVHGMKRILSKPHREVKIDGYVSRGSNQDDNVIYVWDSLV